MTGSNPRRTVLIGTLLASLVALPALVARPWADERFVLYMPEKLVGGNPFLLVSQVIREVPMYLDMGVYRPLSRLGFYVENWIVVRVAVNTGIAPNIVGAVVKVGMISALAGVATATISQYRRAVGDERDPSSWDLLAAALPVVFAASLVLVNPAVHPLTLFPFLYLGTAALALAVPLWLGGVLLREGPPPSRRWRRGGLIGALVVTGAALGSMIELAYLAIPLALVHLVLLDGARRGWSVGGLRRLVRTSAFGNWLALTAGFAAVFLPTRYVIAAHCATVDCYQAATPSFGLRLLELLPFRIGASFTPVPLLAQFDVIERALLRPSLILLEAVIVAFIAGGVLVARLRSVGESGRDVTPKVGEFLPLVAYFGVVIVLAALLASISTGLQEKGLRPTPWRETGFGWVAWSVILTVGFALAWRRRPGARVRSTLVAIVGLTVLVTTLINLSDMRKVDASPEGMLHIEAGRLLADFDPGPVGNQRRCEVVDGLRALAGSDSELRKMNLVGTFLDAAAENNYGELFCDPGPP